MRRTAFFCFLIFSSVFPLLAQRDRITATVDSRRTALMRGNVHPKARLRYDRGRVDASLKIDDATLVFSRPPEQQADLDRLLADQQNPASPEYHKWLTPEQFGERFGASPGDIAKVTAWLESQGLTVDGVARGRGWVNFSGTAQQMESAFHTEIHRYLVNGESHFANATEPSIPAAIEPAVLALRGLNDFRKSPMLKGHVLPDATSVSGAHTLVPDDFATIYDIAKLYGSGVDGAGQKIAIVGQSDIDVSDVHSFRAKYNLSENDPQVVLAGPDPGFTGDILESLLDLEWSGAVARNANIIYVNSTDVDDSAQYAIDQNLAPVLSFSYGVCEQEALPSEPDEMRALAQQASAQGITWLVASGDAGAATCDAGQPEATNGFAVSFPASIPEVIAVGGTQFHDETGTYWNTANTANGDSALSYIPEVAWNESQLYNSLQSSGGGASILFSKPLWQTGPGVPADRARDLPDVSLAAASHDGYSVCLSTTCLVVYGTSASAPSFAGIVALLNQYLVSKGLQSQPGLGNMNPALYRLAQSGANIFHDVVSGDNMVPCVAETPGCLNNQLGYAAGPGYDEATGLGSVDAYNLVTGWTLPAAVTAVTAVARPDTIHLSDSTQVTVTVSTPASRTPDGSVALQLGSQTLAAATLSGSGSSATATLTVYGAQLALGTNTLSVIYSGSGGFLGSASTVDLRASVPTANSEVIPVINPAPVYEHSPDAQGNLWSYTITLTEKAGFATKLTDFTIDGVSYSSQIKSLFGGESLPAFGLLAASMGDRDLSVPATRIFGFSGVDASGFRWTQQIPVSFLGPRFDSYIYGSANAASGSLAAAPGMLLSIYGQNLAPADLPSTGLSASTVPLPLQLGGVSATVNGVAAPLWYVSTNQLNIQVPYETTPGNAVLNVKSGDHVSSSTIVVRASAPGIFTDFAGRTVPFPSGSRGNTYTLFITGEGVVSPPLATGATPAPTTQISQLPAPLGPVSMTIGGVTAPIVFSGIPSGEVGATQINFTVPDNAPFGVQPVVVTVGGSRSLPASFRVTQ